MIELALLFVLAAAGSPQADQPALQMKQVEMIGGVNYERITPQGLFVTYGEKHSDGQLIEFREFSDTFDAVEQALGTFIEL